VTTCGRHLVGITLALLCAAPTVGDVGGCGEEPEELTSSGYARARKSFDCARCKECRLATARCLRACDPKAPSDAELAPTCRPLVHDREVCIRALGDLSCEEFAHAVDDVSPRAPSECLFCRAVDASAPAADGEVVR
jgi:hypothetical protein